MDAADVSIVFFSHHALQMKGLPTLDKQTVHAYFNRADLLVIDEKSALEAKVKSLLEDNSEQTCLLLMSSGTFDGIQWQF
jgi:UDP-N-acetylmuramate: L-alanyl-gamma-D-glutamyl-meso-diaminopimelate ligase